MLIVYCHELLCFSVSTCKDDIDGRDLFSFGSAKKRNFVAATNDCIKEYT